MVRHFQQLDPLNMFNAGVGETSPRKRWAWGCPGGARLSVLLAELAVHGHSDRSNALKEPLNTLICIHLG
ncbi:MAG: hypothetical protein ACTHXC_06740 [Brachybacterium sp.]